MPNNLCCVGNAQLRNTVLVKSSAEASLGF